MLFARTDEWRRPAVFPREFDGEYLYAIACGDEPLPFDLCLGSVGAAELSLQRIRH